MNKQEWLKAAQKKRRSLLNELHDTERAIDVLDRWIERKRQQERKRTNWHGARIPEPGESVRLVKGTHPRYDGLSGIVAPKHRQLLVEQNGLITIDYRSEINGVVNGVIIVEVEQIEGAIK